MNQLMSVLMFHALHTDAVLCNADEHYAMSVISFDDLVRRLSAQKVNIESLRNIAKKSNIDTAKFTVFTFDDGHISNYVDAFPILNKYNFSADFFVNSAYVGTEGYMNWQQIAEMHNNGMSIQSHGHHHYYFDELDKKTIIEELEISKKSIEDKIGHEVTIFAPPGGRITPLVKHIAFELGYTAISTSRPGLWTSNTSFDDIPRLPILKSTSVDRVIDWVNLDKSKVNKIRAKYYTTMVGKKLLGNNIYDKLRSAVLGG